jgi:hypothetical protein
MAKLLLLLQKVDMMITFFKLNTECGNPLPNAVLPTKAFPVWFCLYMVENGEVCE